SSLRCCTTQSMAASICETSTEPTAVPALTEVSFAPGASPLKLTEVSLPTMIPAMCVPCPYVSRYRTVLPCDSTDRSGPLTMRADGRPGTGATPVSTSATPTPVPSRPAEDAPTTFATSAIVTDVPPALVPCQPPDCQTPSCARMDDAASAGAPAGTAAVSAATAASAIRGTDVLRR